MSTLDTAPGQTPEFVEKASDWANAILVKEFRQSLKSRQFLVVFLLMLIGAWLVAMFGLLNAGAAIEYSATGRMFFGFFYGILAIATVLTVPFTAFRSLQTEMELNTYELLHITSLTPRQIVWGKLLSAMVQLFMFYSAIVPFVAFSSLLQGLDMATALYLLTMTFLGSVLLSMFALMLSSMAEQKALQGLLTVGLLGGLVMSLSYAIGGAVAVMATNIIPFDEPGFWLMNLIVISMAVSYFFLFQQIAVARLTWDSANRSTGIRVVCSVQFFLLWGLFLLALTLAPALGGATGSLSDDEVGILFTLSAMHWAIVGYMAVTEENSLSRRIRRDLPAEKWKRLLWLPWLPGGSRGYAYVVGHLFLLFWFATALLGFAHTHSVNGVQKHLADVLTLNYAAWGDSQRVICGATCYLVIYLSLACALGRWATAISPDIRPLHVRIVTLLIIVAGMIFPVMLMLAELIDERGWSPIWMLEPFNTLDMLGSGRESSWHGVVLNILLAGATMGIAVNAKSIFATFRFVLNSHIRPRTETDWEERPELAG